LIQAVLVTIWQDWRTNHPEQFPDAEEELIAHGEEEEGEEQEKPEAITRKLGNDKTVKPAIIPDKKKS